MSRRLRIMHLRASNFLGGPERQILRYAIAAREQGHESIIASFLSDCEGSALLQAAETQRTSTLALSPGSVAALRQLRAAVREQPIDLLCTHGYKADVLGHLLSRSTGVRVASFLRGWTGEDFAVSAYEAVDRLLLRFAWRIVALSEMQAAPLRRRYGTEKVRTVINAVPTSESADVKAAARHELRARLHFARESFVIACAGRLSPEKGTEFFLRAAAEIIRRSPFARFAVFGAGPRREALERLAQQLGLTDRLLFAGHVPDFVALLPGVDLLVNPSLSEEMPNVVMEAMAASVPVVATAVGGLPEICGDAPVLRLVPPRNASAIAQAVLELEANERRLLELGECGRERIAADFSPQRQAAQFQQLLDELQGSPQCAAAPAANVVSNFELPSISVVIPVRNEAPHIAHILQELIAQEYPHDKLEILVADGNSTDATRDIVATIAAKADISIKLLPNPKQLSSAGRNVGARAAQGDIITFVDGHCELRNPKLLRKMAALFEATAADCLCRPQPLDGREISRLQSLIAAVRSTWLGHGRASQIYASDSTGFVDPTSSGASYRRQVFEQVGYFDESLDACEDVDFNYRVHRAGLLAYSSPALAVAYHPRGDLRALWQQMERYGRGRYRFMRKHPRAITASQLVPVGLVLSALSAMISAPFSSAAALFFAMPTFLYILAVLTTTARLVRQHGLYAIVAPAVFATIHFGLASGFLKETCATLFRASPKKQLAGQSATTEPEVANIRSGVPQ